MMCFKKKNKPVRLEKKEESKINKYTEVLKILIKDPSFWVMIGISIIFIIAIAFAINESISYFVYNTGGI